MIFLTGIDTLITSCSLTTSTDNYDCIDNLATTATTIATTLSTQQIPDIHINMASRYLDSLSSEQLIELESKIQEKELEFDNCPKIENEKSLKYKKSNL